MPGTQLAGSLTGEQLIGIDRPRGDAGLAIRIIALLGHGQRVGAGAIRHNAGRAQVVFENIVEGVGSTSDVDPHGPCDGIVSNRTGTLPREDLSTS